MEYTEGDTILHLKDVEVGYGKGSDYKAVLKDINITEKDVIRTGRTTGQTIAIVGRSGRGKSTLFKALTGLVKIQLGQILITDFESEDSTDAKVIQEGDVGFVDQKYTLFRHKTVEQSFLFALRKSDLTKEEKSETIETYLREWGLLKQRKQYPNELSGGQRQRMALIEQILSSGHFMVLDEPTSGLDLINIDDVKKSFAKIQEDHELNTIIFSTHDINFAVEMAESIYVIGYPEGTTEYATIVKHYDLKEMGLAWNEFGIEHLEVVKDIKRVFENS